MLWEVGFLVVIDDFGIGYLLLVYLDKLLVDKLKIDCEFMGKLGVDDQGGVVKFVIDLVVNFGLRVIVEGVEMLE